jgi:methylenetetrahydrofolate dehydrogenase (NADP+)/methenyltetrahydrofolate cyclohydrolase
VKDPSKKCGYRLVGDVDFENVSKRAALITPVPGGVGPLTITMLLYNTVESARKNCALA